MRHPTYDKILLQFDRIRKKNKSLSIVDAGCGNGLFLSMIENIEFGTYKGYDISGAAIMQAKSHWHANRRVKFGVASCTKMPVAANSVDVVVSIGVLQYLSDKDRQRFLLEAKRILRPGGKILISCLTDHLIYRVFDLYGLFSRHGVVDRKKLNKLLSQSGFKVGSSREYGFLIAPLVSQVFCFFADSFDHFVLGTKGKIGNLGRLVRACFYPLERLEYELGPNYGYTLILTASSSGSRSRGSHDKT